MRHPLVVLLLVGAATAACSVQPEDAPPTTPAATEPGTRSPMEVVDAPASTILGLARHRRTRAAVWRMCPRPRCRRPRYAVAVTGPRGRTVADLPTGRPLEVVAAGSGFVLHRRERPTWLLAADGSFRELDRGGGTAPATPGETVLGTPHGPVAVDPRSATYHRVPTPPGFRPLGQHDPWLRGVSYRGEDAYVWSVDGGASWRSVTLPVAGALWHPVVGGPDGSPALVQGADGATLFPFVAAHRLDAARGGWHSTRGPRRPMAYVGGAAVQPDGRLVLAVTGWSDQRAGGRGTPPGLWRSTDDSWSTVEQVRSGPPFAGEDAFPPQLLDIRRTGSALELVALGPQRRTAWVTEDAGRTWAELTLR